MNFFVHDTALIEEGVEIGDGTAIWSHVHIRGPARIGADCIVGEKTYIAYGVEIGDRVKVNALVYLCTGVTLETGVMVSAGVLFTNDRWPRATTPDLLTLKSSEPDDDTLLTRVRQGATLGAGAVIGSGFEIGRFALVGMGAVVTREVADFHLVAGNPARPIGYVCRCGHPLLRFPPSEPPVMAELICQTCGREYAAKHGQVEERDA